MSHFEYKYFLHNDSFSGQLRIYYLNYEKRALYLARFLFASFSNN